ncbi:hypothetical protein EJA05_01225 [Pseudomonas oryziphila]|uniref:Uncharacterized protein n=1 Tax=Pseudomonas entomophila TaxID=312306 RepID=A0A3S8UDQ7_9PSED|nr:hypothetical protein EJA05_01225 [Pseudomonas oryziphila]
MNEEPGPGPGFFLPAPSYSRVNPLPQGPAPKSVGAGLPANEGAALAAIRCLSQIFSMQARHR